MTDQKTLEEVLADDGSRKATKKMEEGFRDMENYLTSVLRGPDTEMDPVLPDVTKKLGKRLMDLGEKLRAKKPKIPRRPPAKRGSKQQGGKGSKRGKGGKAGKGGQE